MNDRLDESDLKLLDAVQRNSRLTAEQLAEKVCLSASAVQRRIHRLCERKVIEAEVAIVSPDAKGLSLTAIVEMTLDTDREHRHASCEVGNADSANQVRLAGTIRPTFLPDRDGLRLLAMR